MSVVDVTNAEHYLWGDACDGWHLLKTDSLSIIEELVPPGGAEQWHLHVNAQQFFYVLAGAATLEVDGAVHVLGIGQGLHIPAGKPHQLRNNSEESVRFLVISEPRSHGDRVNR